jgi:uncharacterized delta-60 repeat protein
MIVLSKPQPSLYPWEPRTRLLTLHIMKRRITRFSVLFAFLVCPQADAATAAPGDHDTSFGSLGYMTTSIGTSDDTSQSIAIQTDGKIVVAGSAYKAGTGHDFALVRYSQDGFLDSTFGVGGKVTTDFGGSTDSDSGTSVAIQTDGRIVVAGSAQGGGIGIARYNSDGSLDNTFSGDGRVFLWEGLYSGANCLKLQDDGKIVVVGDSNSGDFTVVRYNTNGTLDTSFSGDGKLTTDFGGGSDTTTHVALQSNGKILVAGFTDPGPLSDYVLALARYNEDGTLDGTFSGDGKVTTAIGNAGDIAHSMSIQSDGKILLAGFSTQASIDFALVRYNEDGSLDTAFGIGGIVTTDLGFGSDDRGQSVVVQHDGKIVVSGFSATSTFTPNWDFALVRYNGDGTLDSTFSGDGKLTLPVGAGDDRSHCAALQIDGKIVVAGYSFNGTNKDIALARFWAFPPLESWRLRYFGITTNTGNAANTFDFDQDGQTNLLEYGLRSTPTSGLNDSLHTFVLERVGVLDYPTATITKPFGEEGLVYSMEVSGNLSQWDSGSGFTTVLIDNATTFKIRDNAFVTAGNPRFVRLKVAKP